MKGVEHATINTPPAHRLFDPNLISPVLRMRKEAQDAKKATSSNSINAADILAGIANIATVFRGPVAPPAAVQPSAMSNDNSPPSLYLLPHNRGAGTLLGLEEFCIQYQVDSMVHQKLDDEGYKTSHHLQYATVAELKETGFRIGQIASLKDAFSRWSIPLD